MWQTKHTTEMPLVGCGERRITKGTTATTFGPERYLHQSADRDLPVACGWQSRPETRTMPFTDVPVGSYY